MYNKHLKIENVHYLFTLILVDLQLMQGKCQTGSR